jgi:hypothetical protein
MPAGPFSVFDPERWMKFNMNMKLLRRCVYALFQVPRAWK